ncbi:MAG: DUF4197 family protein, partial [Deltaproteobacteria bacterium]|nr:DUF4197 family protein [Deltaproteobacteria bacterium]
MKGKRVLTVAIVLALAVVLMPPTVRAGLGDLIKSIGKGVKGGELTDDKIVQGLKEALQVGTGNAVGTVSKLDGYYKNPEIKIPLPGTVQKVEKVLRGVGYGPKLDEFEVS